MGWGRGDRDRGKDGGEQTTVQGRRGAGIGARGRGADIGARTWVRSTWAKAEG